MKLRELSLNENETLISSQGQQPHNFTARAQVGQGIEWPKASTVAQPGTQEREEVEMPGDHHNVGHHDGHSDGVSESVVNEASGNYLYHSTQDAATAKAILQSGVFKGGTLAAQAPTDAQTKLPTVSFGRSLAYQLSGAVAGRDYQVVFVVDRNALESRYKTLGTSQSKNTRGLANVKKINFSYNQFKYLSPFDTNRDKKLSKDELDAWQQQTGGIAAPGSKLKTAPDDVADIYQDLSQEYGTAKAGKEFEEVVPTRTGTIPWQGMLVGFYLVPGKAAAKDPELLNHPMRLEMPTPNNFVRANGSAPAEKPVLSPAEKQKQRQAGQEKSRQMAIDKAKATATAPAESFVKEFTPAGGGTPPKGPKVPGRDPWGGDDDGSEDPYKYPQPEHYSRSIDFFGRFEADHFDREDFDDATGVFKGYWDDDQIAYFKFDNPKRAGSDDPGMGWYYEPQNESVMEDGEATVSADIAVVAYPMTRGRNRREKRRAARAAVGQRYTPGPAGVGQGVYETSLATMRDYFAGNDDAKDPTKLSQMRDYFSKLSNSTVPDEIQRIIWKLKNQENLFPEEYVKYKNWMEIRRKKVAKEAHVLDHQNVIYRLDKDRPMTDTEVLVLGGAGRYTLGGLRDKARREADALAADLKIEHGGSFRRAAENIKQLTNTLNTIVAAYNELKRIRSRGGRGSRGITDEEVNFIRECTEHMTMLSMYTRRVNQARRIVEGIQRYLKEDKMSHEQASIIKGMFHLKTDPGYGFYRYAIHVAGDHGGDKVVLGPNAGPFAYAYTDAEEKMIRDAVKAITGSEPIELTGGKSEEPDFVNKNSTVPSIDWKKVK